MEDAARSRVMMAALAVALLSVGSVGGSDGPRGETEARGALSFRAQELGADGELDPEGMAAHLVPLDDPDGEVVVRCGEPFVPEPGDYRFWLEGKGWISAAQGRVSHPEPMPDDRGSLVVAPVVRAGRVAFGAATALEPDDEIVLLHLESHNRLGSPQPEMLRRLRGELPSDGVAMPAGPVVVAAYDRARAEYRWISTPLDLPAAGEAVVTPRPPSEGTDLIAVLDRPRAAASFDEYDVEPVLAIDGGSPLAPQVLVPTSERLYAIWYGIEGNLATLTAESPSAHLPERQIPLRAGRVESYHGILRMLPSLTVHLDLPPELELGDDPEVELLTFPERRPLRRQPLRPGERRLIFEKVPASSLEVALDLPPWRLMERTDLSDGLDREIELRLRSIRVWGTVYRGDEPHPATVVFRYWTGEDYLHRVETDDQGRYETRLYRPAFLTWVELRGVDGGPWTEILDEHLTEDTELDFRVPASDWTVRVVAGDSREALAGALVRFAAHEGVPPDERGKHVGRVETDESGHAALPPLPEGELWLTASADGYQTSETLELRVPEDAGTREVEIALVPEAESAAARLNLVLPEGRPAAGAEVLAVAGADPAAEPAWTAAADVEGAVAVPERVRGHLLFVRHPGAGLVARWWDGASGEDGETWALPPAGPPLLVRVTRSWGNPAPWARIALRVHGLTLSGPLLQWVTGSSAVDATGLWRASGIPDTPAVELVAWMPAEDVPRDPAALLASFATSIPYPWSGTIAIEAVE